MAIWDSLITDRDKIIYKKAGFGKKGSLGKRPCIIIIDVQYRTTGEKSEPILKSMDVYPTSCGEAGWNAVEKIKEILTLSRSKDIPVIYAIVERSNSFDAGKWKEKISTITQEIHLTGNRGIEIVEEIAPIDGEIILSKRYASAFFGTHLVTHLNNLNIDTLVVTGATTSGCVRATVTDAFSYGYHVAVNEDAVFDRGEVSHAVSLFDLDQKYANVITHHETLEYLNNI